MPWYEKRIYSGNVLELRRYYATDGGRAYGSKNEMPSSDEQRLANDTQSWLKLKRVLRCNFSRKNGDLSLTLTNRDWVTKEEAKKRFDKMLRDMRRMRRKLGLPELKYIMIREVQSGRPHAHLVLNKGLTMEQIGQLWPHGMAYGGVVDDANDFSNLASYLMEQEKKRRGGKHQALKDVEAKSEKEGAYGENAKEPRARGERRWTGSRNLEKPLVKKRECRPVTLKTMPRAPKGYRLTYRMERGEDRLGNCWLSWECMREDHTERNNVEARKQSLRNGERRQRGEKKAE